MLLPQLLKKDEIHSTDNIEQFWITYCHIILKTY